MRSRASGTRSLSRMPPEPRSQNCGEHSHCIVLTLQVLAISHLPRTVATATSSWVSRPIARACRNSQLVHADPSQILHDDVEMDGKFRWREQSAGHVWQDRRCSVTLEYLCIE